MVTYIMDRNNSASYYGPDQTNICTTLNFEFDESVFSQSGTHNW